jgi:hypothetical protein
MILKDKNGIDITVGDNVQFTNVNGTTSIPTNNWKITYIRDNICTIQNIFTNRSISINSKYISKTK